MIALSAGILGGGVLANFVAFGWRSLFPAVSLGLCLGWVIWVVYVGVNNTLLFDLYNRCGQAPREEQIVPIPRWTPPELLCGSESAIATLDRADARRRCSILCGGTVWCWREPAADPWMQRVLAASLNPGRGVLQLRPAIFRLGHRHGFVFLFHR